MSRASVAMGHRGSRAPTVARGVPNPGADAFIEALGADSAERVARPGPLSATEMLGFVPGGTDDERCSVMADAGADELRALADQLERGTAFPSLAVTLRSAADREEAREAEIERRAQETARFYAECANTPLMAKVLAERDAYRDEAERLGRELADAEERLAWRDPAAAAREEALRAALNEMRSALTEALAWWAKGYAAPESIMERLLASADAVAALGSTEGTTTP